MRESWREPRAFIYKRERERERERKRRERTRYTDGNTREREISCERGEREGVSVIEGVRERDR